MDMAQRGYASSSPADPLPDQAVDIGRRQAVGQSLIQGVTGIPLRLNFDSGFKVFSDGSGSNAPHLIQGFPGDQGIRAGVNRRVGPVAPHVDFPEEEILLIGDALFTVKIKLEQIRIIKALRRLNESHFKILIHFVLRTLRPCAVV